MDIVKATLDKIIAAAEAVDHELHSKIEYLKGLRAKLDLFGSDGSDPDEALVGALREVGNSAE